MIRATVLVAGLALVASAGCVDVPSVFTCKSDAECSGPTTGRCQPSGNCSFADTACGSNGYRYDTSAGLRAGVCVLADQVTQATLDFSHASDQVASNCSSGTPDQQFELTTTGVQTIAFDSPGVGAEIAVYAGTCPPTTPAAGMCTTAPCSDPTYGRNVQTLAAGTYCIVVENAGTSATGMLRMFPLNGTALIAGTPTVSGTTCGHPANPEKASCFTLVGPSLPVLVWQCPNAQLQFAATVTPEAGFDVGLSLRLAIDNTEATGGCVDTSGAGVGEQIHGTFPSPGPYWLMVDGVSGGGSLQCGMFTVSGSP